MKILVSLAVHEEPKVIDDQIKNILKYIKDVVVVLHISKSYFNNHKLDEIIELSKENIFVNPINLDTKWGDIIETHISNFKYINEIVDYDYIIFHSSNDMYIRHGIEDYISKYEAGFNIRKVNYGNSNWWPGHVAIKDNILKEIMLNCGQCFIVASQIEGSFYKRSIIEEIIEKIDKNTDVINEFKNRYPREEIYFSTIASSVLDWSYVGRPTTFSEVHKFDRVLWKLRNVTRFIYYRLLISKFIPLKLYNNFEEYYNKFLFKSKFYKIRIKTIKKIISNDKKYIEKNRFLDDGSGKFELYCDSLFSVKRVNRKYEDKVRCYIRDLD